tara:strand:+ start:5113 stop:5586 length:474 start_codon:yes stop_codon:yes gene_type:complete
MNLVDLCKIIGILLLIIMCWFFVFTVFKTNKQFLMSFTDTPMSNTVEGFSGDNLTQLENTVQMLTDHIRKKRKWAQLDDDGKENQRKLITKIIEKSKEGVALNIVTPTLNKGRGILDYDVKKNIQQLQMYEGLEKIEKIWKGFLKESDDGESGGSGW